MGWFISGELSYLVALHRVNDVFDSAVVVGQTRHAYQPPRSGQGGGGGEESYSGGRARWTEEKDEGSGVDSEWLENDF